MIMISLGRTCRFIGILAGGTILLLLAVGVGVYGMISSPRTGHPAAVASAHPDATTTAHVRGASSPDSSVTVGAGPSDTSSATVPSVPASSDPEHFARAVATALFTWDTSTGYGPADVAQVLVSVGDPTGEEPGLANDVRTYLPTPDVWDQLRAYQTRQWLTIDSAFVPKEFAVGEAQAKPGQIRPGTTAYTITGTRHRAGIVGVKPVRTTHPVSFTVFITCQPTFDTCRLLRVGALDQPLR